ncbi:sulfotransferase family protein [Halomonas sp. M20]|uniref:sulfotransferase family protein n=1 Tax=Halomonas sp. M20 TaxID=2763264 RepID=UPI001D0A6CC3|nr:sulfotransferase [Halomonas sp. M20]
MLSTPFFIIGNPRSGTSLLRLMLNSHPEITVPPECGFSLWLAPKFSDMEDFNESAYLKFADNVAKSKKFETWGVPSKLVLENIMKFRPERYSEMAACVYHAYGEFFNKNPRSLGDKNNYYINHLGEIDQFFPGAQKIFIIRDGRDVACSYIDILSKKINSTYKPKLPSTISEMASEWSLNAAKAIEREKEQGVLIVKYENLIENPNGILREVCSSLGVGFSSEMLSYYQKNDEPTDFMQWKSKTFEPVDKKNHGQYKRILTKDQINEFEKHAFVNLEYFNYL